MFGKRKQRDQSKKQGQEPSVPGAATGPDSGGAATGRGRDKPLEPQSPAAGSTRRQPPSAYGQSLAAAYNSAGSSQTGSSQAGPAPAPAVPGASKPDASSLPGRPSAPGAVASRAEPMRPDQVRRATAAQPSQPHQPGARQPSGGLTAAALAGEEDSKRLIVGRGISLKGEIQACDKLVVEGTVEAELNGGGTLEVSETGLYKGSATIETAEISGRFEGDLTVRDRLYLRSTARVQGTIRYRILEIESGGRIGGTLVELSEDDLRKLDSETSATSAEEPKAPVQPNGSAKPQETSSAPLGAAVSTAAGPQGEGLDPA